MSAAVIETIKAKRLNDRAIRRAASAQRRKEAKEAADRLAEERDEQLAPRIQRVGVVQRVADLETGRMVDEVVQTPRLERAGVGFIRSDPIKHLAARGKIVTDAHVKAANRLRGLWDQVGEGVNVGASDWGRVHSTRGTAPTSPSGHESLLKQVAQQNELMACIAFLGAGWPVVLGIALQGLTVDAYSGKRGWDRGITTGYLVASLDRLIGFWNEMEPERKSRIRSIEIGPRKKDQGSIESSEY